MITPFIAYSRPSHDYTYFAHSALGTHQWALQTGVHIGKWFPPPWQNAYWQMGYAYTFEQPVNHRRVNHGALSMELGYHFTPRLDGHVLIEHSNSYGNGVNATQDFGNPDGSPNFDNIFYHDQLLLARYTRASLGLNYQLNDRYQLSILYGRTLSAANAHFWDYEATFGITRSF